MLLKVALLHFNLVIDAIKKLQILFWIHIMLQIIVGDCMVALDKYVKEGRKFDYVFGDLTDIPISDTPTGEIWDFIRSILEKSFKILKTDGIYLQHVSLIIMVERIRINIYVFSNREMVPIAQNLWKCTKRNWPNWSLKLSTLRPKHLYHLLWKNGSSTRCLSMSDRLTARMVCQ